MQFTLQQQLSHLRLRCAKAEKENAELRANVGLDKFMDNCRKEAEKQNKELSQTIRKQETVISSLQKGNDVLQKQLNKTVSALTLAQENLQKQESRNKEIVEINRKLTTEISRKDQQIIQKDETIRKLKEDLKSTAKEKKELEDKLKKTENKLGHMEVILGRNSSNSGTPSSKNRIGAQTPIVNSREKTDRKPGGQPGHKHYARVQVPYPDVGSVLLYGQDDPLWHDPNYVFEKYVQKVVQTPVTLMVQDLYFVPSFRHVLTGAHKNAECPDWMKDEMNYSPTAKAIALYLNQFVNVSIEKCNDAFQALTSRIYAPSKGFISNLTLEFAIKTEKERTEIFAELLGTHVMHVDGTVIKVGGKQYNIMIIISGPLTLYMFRPLKGHAAVKGTPVEYTTAVLIHDHDVTFYSYGKGHQECLDHVQRYLISCIQNEPDLEWAIKMKSFLIKFREAAKKVDENRQTNRQSEESGDEAGDEAETPVIATNDNTEVRSRFSSEMFESYKNELLELTRKGLEEYEKHPAKTWFPDGKNLCERMNKHPEDYLLFLQDDQVDCSNAEAELGARSIKRKLAACMEFRGFLGVIAYCEAKSCIETLLKQGKELLPSIANIFRREITNTDRLKHLNTVLPLYDDAIKSDENAIEKHTTGLNNAKTELTKKENELAVCQQKYEECKQARINSVGQDGEKTADEENAHSAVISKEHAVYMATREVEDTEERLTFNRKHLEKLQAEKSKCEANIQRLTEEIAKEKAADSESAAKETHDNDVPLADITSPEIQEAIARVNDCLSRYNTLSKEWEQETSRFGKAVIGANIIRQVIDETTGKTKYEYGSDAELDKAAQKAQIDQKHEGILKAIEDLTEAQRNLDSLIKQRKRRNYKKNRKKAPRSFNQDSASADA